MVPVTHLTPYEKIEKFTELLRMTLYEIATLPSVARNDITDRRDPCPTIPSEVLQHK